jgi:hypothetical protein
MRLDPTDKANAGAESYKHEGMCAVANNVVAVAKEASTTTQLITPGRQ